MDHRIPWAPSLFRENVVDVSDGASIMSDSDSLEDKPTVSAAEDVAMAALNKERVTVLRDRTANGDWCICR